MNTQKILIAGLVGGVFAFFFGWLIFGVLFTDMMQYPVEGLMKPESEMIWWAMIVSNLVWGIFIAYIFVMGNINSWLEGVKVGSIVSFLIVLAYDTGFYSMTNMFTLSSMAMDIVVNTLFVACMGAVVGWWLGRK